MGFKCVLIAVLFCGFSSALEFNQTYKHSDVYDVISRTASIKDIAEIIVLNHQKSVSPECFEDLRDFLSSIGQPWTLRMLDASGKLPHGILKGNLFHLGSHKECIDVSTTKPSQRIMRGQHCMSKTTIFLSSGYDEMFDRKMEDFSLEDGLINVGILPRKLKERFGKMERDEIDPRMRLEFLIALCLPSTCEASAINDIFRPSNISEVSVAFELTEPTCTTEKTVELTPGDIGTITFLCVIGFIMLCSTAYDLWFQIILKGNKAEQKPLYVAFSVYTNSKKLFTLSKNPGPLACLYGIRSLSLLWVVIGHRYSFGLMGPYENYLDVVEWTKTIGSGVLLGGTVSVDSFFLLSGLLVSYTFFKSAKLANVSRELPIFYLHRILRLTPLLAVIILLYSTLLAHYGSGPYSYILVEGFVDQCREYWWTTILYVLNYVYEPRCVGQAWYLAVDMQLYILSPILLYPLLWNKKIGLIWLSFWIAAAQASTFAVAYINKYPGGILLTSQMPDFQKNFYIPTHTRAVPYLIGILAGYFLCHSFKENKITTIQYNFLELSLVRQTLWIIGWLASLTVLAAVMFGIHPLNQADTHTFNYAEDTVYLAFSRTAWSIGLLWIIVACGYGFGGPVNWFLSLRVWEILGRFSYAVYLTHLVVISVFTFTENHVKLFTHTHMVLDFFGDMVVSLALSYVLILAFESPIAALEKLLFKRHKTVKTAPELPMRNDNIDKKMANGS